MSGLTAPEVPKNWSRRLTTRTWSLRARVTALVSSAAILLGLLAASAAAVADANRSELDVVLNRTAPLRLYSERLPGTLVDQETGVRGFALSGDEADLEAYYSGKLEESSVHELMAPLMTGLPAVDRQARDVRALAQRWRETVAEPAIAAVRADGPAAGQAILDSGARDRFDALRAAVDALQEEILVVRNAAVAQVNRTGNTLVILLISAAAVVLLAGVSLIVLLNRLVTRPVVDLADQVRQVAGGNYEMLIAGEGPPELINLARDVDAMRRQISADLAVVQQARRSIEEINARLEQQAEELTRSNRDLEQFAYVASHDLQEPLRKVASFCQLLQRRYAGKLDERADQYIAFAVDGAQRMQRLINDLLEFSRIGRSNAEFVPVDLNELMDLVSGQLEPSRRYAGGVIEWGELPTVRGEETLLATLLTNLIGNALKFRRPDVPPLVEVSARQVDDVWEITCKDNGIGIEDEFADKIFVIFQRLHAKDAYPGTGIGLAIGKKIVEHHGGRIWVEPDTGVGSVIKFTLPIPAERLDPAGFGLAPVGELPAPVDMLAITDGSDAAGSPADATDTVATITPASPPAQRPAPPDGGPGSAQVESDRKDIEV
jgi:signal transduction histidine kinase